MMHGARMPVYDVSRWTYRDNMHLVWIHRQPNRVFIY